MVQQQPHACLVSVFAIVLGFGQTAHRTRKTEIAVAQTAMRISGPSSCARPPAGSSQHARLLNRNATPGSCLFCAFAMQFIEKYTPARTKIRKHAKMACRSERTCTARGTRLPHGLHAACVVVGAVELVICYCDCVIK